MPSLAQGRPLRPTALQQREIRCTRAVAPRSNTAFGNSGGEQERKDTGQTRLEELGYHQELHRRCGAWSSCTPWRYKAWPHMVSCAMSSKRLFRHVDLGQAWAMS